MQSGNTAGTSAPGTVTITGGTEAVHPQAGVIAVTATAGGTATAAGSARRRHHRAAGVVRWWLALTQAARPVELPLVPGAGGNVQAALQRRHEEILQLHLEPAEQQQPIRAAREAEFPDSGAGGTASGAGTGGLGGGFAVTAGQGGSHWRHGGNRWSSSLLPDRAARRAGGQLQHPVPVGQLSGGPGAVDIVSGTTTSGASGAVTLNRAPQRLATWCNYNFNPGYSNIWNIWRALQLAKR